jgi:hypothetical protein
VEVVVEVIGGSMGGVSNHPIYAIGGGSNHPIYAIGGVPNHPIYVIGGVSNPPISPNIAIGWFPNRPIAYIGWLETDISSHCDDISSPTRYLLITTITSSAGSDTVSPFHNSQPSSWPMVTIRRILQYDLVDQTFILRA